MKRNASFMLKFSKNFERIVNYFKFRLLFDFFVLLSVEDIDTKSKHDRNYILTVFITRIIIGPQTSNMLYIERLTRSFICIDKR